jgi:pectinesterase
MKWIWVLLVNLLFVNRLFAQQPVLPLQLTVAQDGSGNYQTIQEAVNAVRDLSQQQVTIRIRNGIYREKLVIPTWKTHISLVGESAENTIITNADYSGKPVPGGKDAYGKDKMSTYTSYTVLVQGDNFKAENLTIRNTAGRVGQAVALHVEADRCVIKNCRILGNQDTLYTATGSSRQVYQECYIEGTTDFIFGEATAVFWRCTIKSLTNSYVTAAATTPQQAFGYVFQQCKLMADSAATKVFLGRPWRPYAKTVFINTEMGSHIVPQGWNPWKGDAMFPEKEKTAFYAEINSSGPGGKNQKRVDWSKQLKNQDAKNYSLYKVVSGADNWNPFTGESKPHQE